MGELPGPDREAWSGWRPGAHAVLHLLLRLLCGLDVRGLEHIPRSGPVILAGNHASYLDGVVAVIAAAGARKGWPLTKVEIYRVPLLGLFLRKVNTIPLDRRGDVSAMRGAIGVLERGGCIVMFPEGTRSKTGERLPAKGGVGFLAGLTRAQVVPMRINGTRRFPFARLEVRFGAPLRYSGSPDDRVSCRAFAESVLDRVFGL